MKYLRLPHSFGQVQQKLFFIGMIIFIFCLFPNISFSQNFLPPTPAISNLVEELQSVNKTLETKSTNDYPTYHLAYAKRLVIVDIISEIKSGTSVASAYEKSTPSDGPHTLQTNVFYLPDNNGKISLSWVETEILPLITQ